MHWRKHHFYGKDSQNQNGKGADMVISIRGKGFE
jgi:hypothetical protein